MIKYNSGYKYQLTEDHTEKTSVFPTGLVSTRYLKLDVDGTLTIRTDYAWDGPSGPTIDTEDSMRASLVHDALYQLLRFGLIDPTWREQADKELYRICVEDGMSHLRAKIWYDGVRAFGGNFSGEEKPDTTFTVTAD